MKSGTKPTPGPTAADVGTRQMDSLLAYLTSCAFEWADTLDPNAKHRSYYRCKVCSGTNEDREHYKMERAAVQHKDGCLVAKHSPAMARAVNCHADLVAALQSVEAWLMDGWTEDDVKGDALHPMFRKALLKTRAALAKAGA